MNQKKINDPIIEMVDQIAALTTERDEAQKQLAVLYARLETPGFIDQLISERDEAVAARDAWAKRATEEAKRCLDNGVAKNKAISERARGRRSARRLQRDLRRRTVLADEAVRERDELRVQLAIKSCKWHRYRLNTERTHHIVDAFPMPCEALDLCPVVGRPSLTHATGSVPQKGDER